METEKNVCVTSEKQTLELIVGYCAVKQDGYSTSDSLLNVRQHAGVGVNV